jgi:hypothetical protein
MSAKRVGDHHRGERFRRGCWDRVPVPARNPCVHEQQVDPFPGEPLPQRRNLLGNVDVHDLDLYPVPDLDGQSMKAGQRSGGTNRSNHPSASFRIFMVKAQSQSTRAFNN